MSILKQVIKYDNANAIEATWVDRIEVQKYESVYDENDPKIVVEEHQVGVEMRETVIRCHAYDGSQMQMFRDDVAQYGGNIAEYEALIAEVEAAHVPLPPTSLADIKSAKRADLIADCESAIAAIRASYPESEVLSWSKQEAEARALGADANAATPLLDALAEARGIAKSELAARVIAKADAFAAISGALIGKRQKLEDQLDALPSDATPDHVAKIVW